MPFRPSTLIVATGLTLTSAFVAYCAYFDQKRQLRRLSSLNSKQKLPQRRQNRVEISCQDRKILKNPTESLDFALPDEEVVRNHFLEQVQLAHESFERVWEQDEDDYRVDEGVRHLAAAISVAKEPERMILLIDQTMPVVVLNKLLLELRYPTSPLDKPMLTKNSPPLKPLPPHLAVVKQINNNQSMIAWLLEEMRGHQGPN